MDDTTQLSLQRRIHDLEETLEARDEEIARLRDDRAARAKEREDRAMMARVHADMQRSRDTFINWVAFVGWVVAAGMSAICFT
jgi:roadblock/LC7 domain-containing protein